MLNTAATATGRETHWVWYSQEGRWVLSHRVPHSVRRRPGNAEKHCHLWHQPHPPWAHGKCQQSREHFGRKGCHFTFSPSSPWVPSFPSLPGMPCEGEKHSVGQGIRDLQYLFSWEIYILLEMCILRDLYFKTYRLPFGSCSPGNSLWTNFALLRNDKVQCYITWTVCSATLDPLQSLVLTPCTITWLFSLLCH